MYMHNHVSQLVINFTNRKIKIANDLQIVKCTVLFILKSSRPVVSHNILLVNFCSPWSRVYPDFTAASYSSAR